MTSPQLRLLPTGSDDRFAFLAAPELAAGGVFELGQRAGIEVSRPLKYRSTPSAPWASMATSIDEG
jgi:hypothetical protein